MSTIQPVAADQTRPASILPGVGIALLSGAAFGSSGIAARPLLNSGWSAAAVVLFRLGVAALVLLIPAAFAMRGRWRLLRSKAGILLAFGVLAVALAQVCYFNAVQHLSIGVALLLEYSGILLVVGWNWLRSRQQPPALTLTGAVVAVVGLAFVLDAFGGLALSGIGVLWGLGAAVGLATYFVLAARTEDGLPSIVVVSSGMVIGSVTIGLLGLVGIMPLRFSSAAVTLNGATMSWLVPALWLSIVTAAFAYLSGVLATRRLGSTTASFLGLTEVLFAVLFAWLLLDEVPRPVQLVGGIGVLVGVVLVRIGELRAAAPAG